MRRDSQQRQVRTAALVPIAALSSLWRYAAVDTFVYYSRGLRYDL